jgi:signal peptidase I
LETQPGVEGGEGQEVEGDPTGGGGPEAEPASRRRDESVLSILWDWTRSLAVAFLLFLLIRALVVEAFKIPTSSMENTLLVGDFLLVNKAVYGAEIPGTSITLPAFTEPDRGDVVVFNPPHDPVKNYVKRLVGMPGDTLEMRGKQLYLNGVALDEPYARYVDREGDAVHPGMSWQESHLVASNRRRGYRPSRDSWGPIEVPEDRFFVLGDNRDNSEDSRYWGFVDRSSIRGRPWFVYYSFDAARIRGLPWVRDIRWERIGGLIR